MIGHTCSVPVVWRSLLKQFRHFAKQISDMNGIPDYVLSIAGNGEQVLVRNTPKASTSWFEVIMIYQQIFLS
tara:strand:- start:1287 stop:1502 length:216 start_codon:yes stop_codon:yes gene_type:complete